jgi:hypothetical protein
LRREDPDVAGRAGFAMTMLVRTGSRGPHPTRVTPTARKLRANDLTT